MGKKYPLALISCDMASTWEGQALTHSPHPLHRFFSTRTVDIPDSFLTCCSYDAGAPARPRRPCREGGHDVALHCEDRKLFRRALRSSERLGEPALHGAESKWQPCRCLQLSGRADTRPH